MEKHRRLEQILRSQDQGSKIIIFCSTKKMCDQLARNLTRQFGAAAIHGDKSQAERDHVLNQFRTGRSPVLVATDVAARGLDIKDIRWLTNCLSLNVFFFLYFCGKYVGYWGNWCTVHPEVVYFHLNLFTGCLSWKSNCKYLAGWLSTMTSLQEWKIMFIGLEGLEGLGPLV